MTPKCFRAQRFLHPKDLAPKRPDRPKLFLDGVCCLVCLERFNARFNTGSADLIIDNLENAGTIPMVDGVFLAAVVYYLFLAIRASTYFALV